MSSLLRCHITVDCEGNASAVYRWSDAVVDGNIFYDEEDVDSWSDGEIVRLIFELIGVEDEEQAAEVTLVERQ